MKKRMLVIVLILAGVLCTSACNKHKSPAADTVLIHARIYTVNSKEPWAQAMAVREGKIIAVGSDKDIDAYRGSSTKVIDAKDHMTLPSLNRSH
jgi:predicted amidohydrolase YtcJ